MDYTLIHYDAHKWELRAYEYLKEQFQAMKWPVESLKFDPSQVCRGLIIDTEHGNLVKANRFGFIKRAMHGTRVLDFEEQRNLYSRTIVDLADRRWVFLNTFFSLSEGCLYGQLVELLDQRRIPEVLGYADLYHRVKTTLDAAHMEGRLKAEIIAKPDQFVLLDPEIPLTLLDQRHAGKKLMLITNSEWHYTVPIMRYAFDQFLPKGTSWRDLFDLVIISARKPDFFTTRNPFFEVATEDGLLKPQTGALRPGVTYLGGSARQVETYLGLSGDEILYVGDHVFGDVHVTKNVLRWRTALILRELEDELKATNNFRDQQAELERLMVEKEALESRGCQIRVELQRKRDHYAGAEFDDLNESEKQTELETLRTQLIAMDQKISPLAQASSSLSNSSWGLLMRTGNDKSYLAYQVERYADIYTSRVSNLLSTTPFAYLRSARGSLPHD
jgi:HAD superfamily 5'-nucleotidase-like hydrolase